MQKSIVIWACAISAAAIITALAPTKFVSAKVLMPKASGPIHLYLVASGVHGANPCMRPHLRDIVDIASSVQTMLAANVKSIVYVPAGTPVELDSYQATNPIPPPTDVLAGYLAKATAAPPVASYVVIATVCKTEDVTTLSLAGYDVESGVVQSGSMSGTFDQLESGAASAWANLFGTQTPAPYWTGVPNVAFLPVGNDPNGVINPRLLHNLPLTVLATPAPLGPTAPPSPGSPAAPTPPADRLSECESSAYRMLVTGRVPIQSQTNDLSRGIVAAGSLKWNQPKWDNFYTSFGLLAAFLYNPNSAEVGVDIFVCPPPTTPDLARTFRTQSVDEHGTIQSVDGVADQVYQVGGLNHDIDGHKSTSTFGLDPFAQQHALDDSVVDLANQIECIISQETKKMGITTIYTSSATPITAKPWCTVQYWDSLEGITADQPLHNNDARVTSPINAQLF